MHSKKDPDCDASTGFVSGTDNVENVKGISKALEEVLNQCWRSYRPFDILWGMITSHNCLILHPYHSEVLAED